MRASGWRRTAALLAVTALVAVGCGSDDNGDAGDDPTDGDTGMAMDLPADVQAIADSGLGWPSDSASVQPTHRAAHSSSRDGRCCRHMSAGMPVDSTAERSSKFVTVP